MNKNLDYKVIQIYWKLYTQKNAGLV